MTQQEVIKAFNQSLNNTELSGRAALDEAVRASSDFANYQEVVNQFRQDQKSAKSWHRFLVEKCGIILDNADTGAITGSDAGGTEKTATTIMPAKGNAKYPSGTSFTVDGLTIYGIPDKSLLTKDQQYVVKGLYSWWIKDALALIKESFGYSYSDADTTNSRLKLEFINDSTGEFKDTLAYLAYDSDDCNKWESRVLCINMAHFKNMKSSDHHGTAGKFNLDRTLVHELVHGIMASNVNYFYDLPTFLKEGGTAELVHGIDDERYNDIISYAKNPSAFANILNATFTDANYEVYAGGYIFMRYFAKQAATDTTFDYDTYRKTVSIGSQGGFATNYWDTVTMKGGKGNDTLTNSGSDVSITAGAAADLIKSYSSKVTINAGSGNDEIFNDGSNVSISGGKGKDSIGNYGDKVTIGGGTGNDSIRNFGAKSSISGADGNDFISNSVSTFNTIAGLTLEQINTGVKKADDIFAWISTGSAALTAYTIELVGGNSSSLYGGAGNDSLENYANKARLYGDAGKDIINNYGYKSTVYGGANADIIFNGDSSLKVLSEAFESYATISVSGDDSKLYGGDGNDTVSNESSGVKIYGQNGADSIDNSGTNTSIYGGADNDYVYNSGGNSYISLGDGIDSIWNTADDVVISGGNDADELINQGRGVVILGDAGNDNFINFGDYSSLLGGKGNDTIYSSGAGASLFGGAGKDYLYNEGVQAYIFGGSGNDTIYNEGDHVTIAGGTGNDSIANYGGKHNVYQFGTGDGKDTVIGFNDGDTVQIMEGSYTSKKSGNNVIVSVGTDKLTLRNAADKTINFITSSDVTGASDSLAKDIRGGKGNDSLWGGKGNDSLYGGGGDDTFIYTPNEGTDTIFDYSSGDMLQILNADGSAGSFKSSKYSGGDLTLAINGGGSVVFNGVSSGDTFNINNKTYTLGNKKLQ